MSDEARLWMEYARENLGTCRLALENGYHNASMQNAQQAVEKALKALVLDRDLGFHKTHSIMELRSTLVEGGVYVDLSEDESDLLDAIYVPSKYPMVTALPDMSLDEDVCERCLEVAERVVSEVSELLEE